jgi:energy-coupling factor transporter ATP-binding protein EcfA2
MVESGMQHFIGRNWVLPRVLDWLEKTEGSTFVLTGQPGSGKTSLTAWIAGFQIASESENSSDLNQLRSYVRAVHYCRDNTSNTLPRAFAQSLAEQLMRNVDGFSDELKAAMGDGIHIVVNQHVGEAHSGANVAGVKLDLGNLNESSSVNRIIREPLHRLYAKGSSEPILILIDALDESTDLEQPTGLVLFSRS